MQNFFANLQQGQAFVCYKSRDSAIRAQQALNSLPLGGSTIVVEFLSESDATLFSRLLMGGPPPNAAQAGNVWPAGAPPMGGSGSGGGAPGQFGGHWGGAGGPAAGGALWNDDPSLLPGGLGL